MMESIQPTFSEIGKLSKRSIRIIKPQKIETSQTVVDNTFFSELLPQLKETGIDFTDEFLRSMDLIFYASCKISTCH